jgi:5S rRNA maturation endonuclease (ribonuclease M5)
MIKKKSRSHSQNELKVLCDALCDNIENVLSSLDLHDYRDNSKMLTMSCPIHGGDNESALNLYYEGDTYRGNWKCRTHQCEKYFKGSILGFIRGVLSAKKYHWSQDGDTMCSFQESMSFAKSLVSNTLNTEDVMSSIKQDKNNFARIVDKFIEQPLISNKINRQSVINNIDIPSQYYIDRGFSKDILIKYDVGLCDNPHKPMYNRVVVPIYDDSGKYLVGCTGRSIFNKCDICASYHDPENHCPDKDKQWQYSKWKHSYGFKSQNHLYNFWYAKNHILKEGYAIIVESPGNVWRLEENNIYNSIGLFGCNLSDRQKLILDSSGAMTLFIITDNDEAGKKAAKEIKEKCTNTYRLFFPAISKSDIGEMTNTEIDEQIKHFIEAHL